MTFASFPRTILTAAAVTASLSCGTEAPGPSRQPNLDEGVAWELAEHRRQTLSEVRYAFDLRVPADRAAPILGNATVRFQWQDETDHPLVLDFLEPGNVDSVRVNEWPASFEAVNDHVVIDTDGLVAGQENAVELYFTAGDGSLNRNDEFLYTLFVPERARFALPVFDQPNLKGRFTVTLQIPADWTAVANGPLAESSVWVNDVGEEVSILRFEETRLLPTYLFAFAAGRFQVETAERDGRVMNFYHRETDSEKVERNLEAIFDLHATAISWLEEYTGIEYPFQKFDWVGIPSFQYGGMEHAGAILYRASSLFLDESATQAQYLGRASVIAHETAHMWFGDLVTMNWFGDVWMKEVFANFMAAKIVHPSFPDINHDLRFLSHHQAAYAVDRSAGANPIRQPLDNLREAGTLYGAIIYQKAPVVMKLLERLVGEDVFRDGLRQYLHAFEYGNATWPDLVGILDDLSPEDVTAWSRVWVEDAGRPDIEVRMDPSSGTLVASQRDPSGQGRVWPQSLGVLLGSGEGGERVEVRMRGPEASRNVVGEAQGPDFLLPESEAVGYGHFRLDEGSREYLLEHVASLEDPVVRGVAWLTLWDAVLEGEVDPGRFLDLLVRGATTETDELNLQRVLGFLETTYWRLLLPADRAARAQGVEEALWARMEAVSTTTAKSALFGTYRDVALTDGAVVHLEEIWEAKEVPGVPLSEDDLTTLAYALAVREVVGWQDILDRQADATLNPDRRARFLFVGPALSSDPAVRSRFFRSLADPANREREPWVLTAMSYLNHPLRAAEAEQHVGPALELLDEIQRTGDIFFPKRWLDATLGGHNSSAVAATVRDFLDNHPDYPPRLRAKILQSADMLFRSSAILEVR